MELCDAHQPGPHWCEESVNNDCARSSAMHGKQIVLEEIKEGRELIHE